MITIVVGGQYGGEGKGKVSAYIASSETVHVACRCGGPNSSHTVLWQGKTFRLRMMPTAAVVNPKVDVFFGAGTLIHIPTLLRERDEIGHRGELVIDRRAGIITEEIVQNQRKDERYNAIGSTLTGTGYATAMRSLRTLKLAAEFSDIREFVNDLAPFLQKAVQTDKHILLEGHQGYGLSNYHGDYPYVSSRDSTAGSMLAEVGLGPRFKNLRVVLAAKMFPTRNHQGNLNDEMSAEDADLIGITEYGGGSWGIPDVRRRVGYIDLPFLSRSAFANGATEIALTGVDYFARSLANETSASSIPGDLEKVIAMVKQQTRTPVRYLSTGPETFATIDLVSKKAGAVGGEIDLHGFRLIQ